MDKGIFMTEEEDNLRYTKYEHLEKAQKESKVEFKCYARGALLQRR
jgi:hypothetical protein